MFDEIKLNIIKMNERFIYVYIIIKNKISFKKYMKMIYSFFLFPIII